MIVVRFCVSDLYFKLKKPILSLKSPYSTYPSEIVVQLQVGGVAGGLRHGANDAGQLVGRSGAQQTGEDIAQRKRTAGRG